MYIASEQSLAFGLGGGGFGYGLGGAGFFLAGGGAGVDGGFLGAVEAGLGRAAWRATVVRCD